MQNEEYWINPSLSYRDIFGNLLMFGIKKHEIIFEVISPSTIFDTPEYRVNSVSGFSTPSEFRDHIDDLYSTGFSLFRKAISKYSKAKKLEHYERLVNEVYEFQQFVISKINPKEEYRKFNRHEIIRVGEIYELEFNINNDSILLEVSPFPVQFFRSMRQAQDDLKYRIQMLRSNIDIKAKPVMVYEYRYLNKSSDNLNILFDNLCIAGFISKEVNTVSDFKSIFSGKRVLKKISWQTKNEDLHWFIKTLKTQEILRSNGNSWIKACNCFTNIDNESYEVEQLSKSHRPKRSEEIYLIVKNSLQLGV